MEILIIFLLILLNGVFSMSEIALVSSRKFKLESSARKGNKNARKALELAENPNTFLSTVQIGITLIGILTGVYSGETLTKGLTAILSGVTFLAPYSDSLAVSIVVLIITYFSIVFGELIPKRIGLAFPEKIASLVARPMTLISLITKPFIWIMGKTNDLFLKLFRIQDKQDDTASEEEIKSIIAQSTDVGEILKIEEDIVKRVFALGNRKAGQLMTHRSDLVCIDIADSVEQIRKKIEEFPHSVYPVVDKNFDGLKGTLSVNALFTQRPSEFSDILSLIEDPVYLPENLDAYKVLEKFKEHKTHMIVIVDEYGSSEGVITITDVVDALIGEVALKTKEEVNILKREENSWLAEGQCPFYEFVHYFNLDNAEGLEDFTTLAGLVLKNSNDYPATGDRIKWNEFAFEVLDMDERRIDKILITRQPDKKE
jgi:putative hemolysin